MGGDREFEGSLGTQVVKLFDLVAARTGLREREASSAGFDPFSVETTVWDHKAYYPGAHEMHLRITGDRQAGRLLGAAGFITLRTWSPRANLHRTSRP